MKLFEITDDLLESGMRGFPVGYCVTSYVDPDRGLFYIDQAIEDLASCSPEKVIYLLYRGYEGSPEEVAAFFQDLQARSSLAQETIASIEKLPKKGHPMDLLSAALLLLGIHEGKNNYREDALNLIAKIPHLVALCINHHAGFGKTPLPKSDLGYMENFAYMLQIPHKREAELVRALKLFNILHYDHGGGNLSTFVGKAVASGLEPLYGSMAAAMCALAGPRHGRANQDCLAFVQQCLEDLGENPTAEQVANYIEQLLKEKRLIYGFGHAVLRVEDPRATLFYSFATTHYPTHPLVKMALTLRGEVSKILAKNPKISDPHPNVDAMSGVVLYAAGFPYPEYFTLLFGLARVVGISIQIVYERVEARGGKGLPIVRPRYLFKKRL